MQVSARRANIFVLMEVVAAIAFLAMTIITFLTIRGQSERELMPSDVTASLLIGTLVPAMDVEGTRKATEEYNALKHSGR